MPSLFFRSCIAVGGLLLVVAITVLLVFSVNEQLCFIILSSKTVYNDIKKIQQMQLKSVVVYIVYITQNTCPNEQPTILCVQAAVSA